MAVGRKKLLERAKKNRLENPERWTYKRIAEYLGISEMGAYYALNPEKRLSAADRADGLRPRSVALSEPEWQQVKARGRVARVSASTFARRILLGEERPLDIEPRLEGDE